MTRALFVEKLENVCFMLQRRCRHKEVATILNLNMESVHNIRKTYLLNVNVYIEVGHDY